MSFRNDATYDSSFINRVPIFQGLRHEELDMLKKVTKSHLYHKGEFIFREGEPSETLYIVFHGLIKITKVTEDGKEQIVRLLFPGDFFGQSALLQTEIHYANAEALEDTVIFTIQKPDFLMAMERNRELLLRFMRALHERIYQADEWMSLLSLMEVEQRLARVLLLFSEKVEVMDGKFKLPITKKALASLIGTTPETISRKLVALVSENVITLTGQREIQILNTEALKRIAKP